MKPQRIRVLLAALAGVAVVATVLVLQLGARDRNVPDLRDARRVAAGRLIYESHCAACHGASLEGQPNWKTRLPNGRLPAPPHDDSGHTWHHANAVLFELTKEGLKPHVSADYQSDMPAFAGTLSDDEIWNVLAYIQSRWSDRVRAAHAELDARTAEQRRRGGN